MGDTAKVEPLFAESDRGSVKKPFLRWAGGKLWLIPLLDNLLGARKFNNYHEPFVGAGAVFLNASHRHNKVFLSDLNVELITTYEAVRDDHTRVLAWLGRWEVSREFYNVLRQKQFNNPYMVAARMIYLNFHSYNGIYRVNSKGLYNVPFGRRDKTSYPEVEVAHFAQALGEVDLRTQDFEATLNRIGPGDLVYVDPPYTVSHNDNGFIAYNQKLFSFDDQIRLRNFTREVEGAGAYFVVSNANHEAITTLYKAKHLKKMVVHRANKIGGRAAQRGRTTELVITNIR